MFIIGSTPYNLDISTFDPGDYSLVITSTAVDGAIAISAFNFTVEPPGMSSVRINVNTLQSSTGDNQLHAECTTAVYVSKSFYGRTIQLQSHYHLISYFLLVRHAAVL